MSDAFHDRSIGIRFYTLAADYVSMQVALVPCNCGHLSLRLGGSIDEHEIEVPSGLFGGFLD